MSNHTLAAAVFDGPGGPVSGPWWLWRHQFLRRHGLTLTGMVMQCSCGRSATVGRF